MTNPQVGAVCPQCGSAAAVHSIEELAAIARSQLGQQGFATPPQPGFAGPPQPGAPQPGPVPGWAGQPRPGPPGGWRGMRSRLPDNSGDGLSLDSLEGDIAGVAITAAAKFIGRRIGRRVQQTVSERVLPAMAAKQQEMLQTQIAIAERHPDLRACLNDKVVFLAGGSRVQPMPNLAGPLTVEQADALVATLRNG